MAVGPSKLDLSKVHILLLRHAEAVSNVAVHPGPEGSDLDGLNLTMPQLQALAAHLLGTTDNAVAAAPAITLGDCLPDGLTQHGLDTAADWVDAVTDHGTRRMENVYALVSSPLTRAVQTLDAVQQAFDGPFRDACRRRGSVGGGSNLSPPIIYCHPGIMEATSWVQDIPALATEGKKDGIKTATYIKIAGGRDDAPGRVLGEETVDLSHTVWPDGVPLEWTTAEGRKRGLRAGPKLYEIEEGARRARVWLRECAKKVLIAHQSAGRTGNPRIVVCLHGGIVNFLTQRWYCAFERDDDEEEDDEDEDDTACGWRWRTSTTLRNLEANVYTFLAPDENEARMTELEPSEAYAELLGKHYRHMASGAASYGSLVDQKAEHWRFIQESVLDVRSFGDDVLDALVNWRGAADLLARFPYHARL